MRNCRETHPHLARRLARIAAAFVLFSVPLAIEAQQPGKVYRVGTLGDRSSDPIEARLWQAFRQGLRERGWTERGNISIEPRWAEGDPARLPELAAGLVRLKVDVIVARSSSFVQAAKQATSSIPIVFVVHLDPVGTGHVASLAKPGGNSTGLALLQTDLSSKALELLTLVVPHVKRIAVLWNPGNPASAPALKTVEGAGRATRIQVEPVGAQSRAELEGAFSTMARGRTQAVLVLPSPLFFAERQRVAELALVHRLPTMFGPREAVEVGGLMSYGATYDDMFQRAAGYVDKILKGAKPGDLPVEQPTKFELVINLKTAKALELTIPQSVLLQASQVLE
jgi:putative ABC transport system substrate-binding protein